MSKKVIFAKPTYGPVPDPEIDKNHRLAIMYAAAHGIFWAGDASTDRLHFVPARNKIARASIEEAERDPEIVGTIWQDADMLVHITSYLRLVEYELDFVSGLYFGRKPPFFPVAGNLNAQGHIDKIYEYPENTIFPVDAVGFGLCFTSINLLKKVSALPESKEDGPFGNAYDAQVRDYGEDNLFCIRAGKTGTRPLLDTALKASHLIGSRYSNEKLFNQFRGTLVKSRREDSCQTPSLPPVDL